MIWLKKAWKFCKDQWAFTLAFVIGVIGAIASMGGASRTKEVLDLKNKGEKEEREALKKAREETESILKKLDDDLSELEEEKREVVEMVREANKEEFEKQVIENRDKPLDEIADDLAKKYGLTKV
mgnify:CR=1 FL=1